MYKYAGYHHEYYFYADGNMIGCFGSIPDAKDPPTDIDFDLNFHAVDENFPPPVPYQYTPTSSDQSFSDIAYLLFHDRSYAALIAAYNNYAKEDPVPVGMPLRIPRTLQTTGHNWEGIYPLHNEAADD